MNYQVLARKWRPRQFTELIGQDHVVQALSNALATNRLHHAYLFTGTRGVGKTTVARIFAKCLNCESGVTAAPCGECSACRELDEGRFVDLIEVDAASRAKVDETRDLMDNVQYAAARGRFKVYLIDEVHMFSAHSFNALLKTLEEPPEHVKFLLATTDPQKLPVTVLSRCLQFHMRQLPPEEVSAQLRRLAALEELEAEEGALALIGRAAAGSMRDGLSLMDQAIAHGAGVVREADVRAMLGVTPQTVPYELLRGVASGDAAAVLAQIDALVAGAPDFEALLGDLLVALQRVAVAQLVPERHQEDEHAELVHVLAAQMTPEDVQLNYQIGIMGRRDLPYALDPRSGFEMTLLRMLAFKPDRLEVESDRHGTPSGGSGSDSTPADLSPREQALQRAQGGPAAEPRAAPSPSSGPAARPVMAPASRDTGFSGRAAGTEEEPPPPTDDDLRPPVGEDDGFADWSTPSAPDALARVKMPAGNARTAPQPAAPARPAGAPLARPRTVYGSERGPNDSGPEAPSPTDVWPADSSSVGPGAAASRGGSTDRQTVSLTPAAWAALVPQLRLTGLARELGSNCELVSHDDGRVVVRVAPEHAQLAMQRAVDALGKALGEHVGAPLRVSVETGELSGESLALAERREAEAAHASATAAIRGDPTVQAICDMFDATIDPSTVRSIDRDSGAGTGP